VYKGNKDFQKLSFSIPKPTVTRKTIFFDESGQGKMPDQNIKFNSNNRYFIYTGVMFNNYDLKNFENYYFYLKKKFFNKAIELHATRFFRRNEKNIQEYIQRLSEFLDTIPFLYITAIVDKKRHYDEAKKERVKEPLDTTLRKALSICMKKGLKDTEFYKQTVREVFRNISSHTFRNIKNYYPLELAYRTILEAYFYRIYPELLSFKHKNWVNIQPLTELKFETSPNRQRILKYTENFRGEMSEFGNQIKKSIYDISFPFKKARYMGLEIADIISYGYNLLKYHRLNRTRLFKPIRKVLLKKERRIKNSLGTNPVIEK